MSLKSFEINYGFNGEASTASLSFVVQKKTCGGYEDQPSIGTFGETARTTNTVIDEKIKDFIINEVKESKEAGFKTLSYELVDKEAKRLESIAVLVRGVTAPPVGSDLNYFGKLFPAAEIGSILGAPLGQSSVILSGQLAVIGRTFSVVTASSGDETGTLFYSGGSVVGQAPQGPFSSALRAQLSSNEKSAEVRYGYYLSDLKKLLDLAGYVVVAGYPTESNFILMDFGGSLKDVVGSLASMFGLYWSVRGNKITFYKSTDLMALDVPKFNEDPDPAILSSSQSKDILGKSSVGVIVGSSPNDSAGGGSGDSTRKVNFLYVGLDSYFSKVKSEEILQNFFSFFKFGESDKLFDRFIMQLLVDKKAEFKQSPFFTKFYGDFSFVPTTHKLSDVEQNTERREQLKEMHFLKDDSEMLQIITSSGLSAPMASETGLLGAVKSSVNLISSLYISKPKSKSFTERYEVASGGGLSSHGPYLGSTELSKVPEISEAVAVFQFFLDEEIKTIRDLYNSVNATNSNSDETVLNEDTSYHYIGIADVFNDVFEKEQAAAIEAVNNVSKEGSGTAFSHNSANYLVVKPNSMDLLKNMMSTSTALYNKITGASRSRQINVPATKENSSSSSSGAEPWPSEFKSFIVRDGSRPLSSVDVMKFDGTTDEAEYLDANFSSLVGPAFYPESSSVTYDGLKIPDDNPLLTSLSVSFSSGGIETSFQYSNKDFLSADNQVIMSGYKTNSARNFYKALRTRQKNFLGVR